MADILESLLKQDQGTQIPMETPEGMAARQTPTPAFQSVSQPPPDLPLEQPPSQQDGLDVIRQGLVTRFQSLQDRPASGGPVRQLLQNFFSDAGKFLMGDRKEHERQQTLQNLVAVSNAQSNDEYRKALAQQAEMVDVGDGVQIPRKSLAQFYAAKIRAMTASEAEAGRNERFGLGIQSKEDLAAFIQGEMNKRQVVSEGGKDRRAQQIQRILGTYQPLMDNTGNITGFYNSKNPNVVIRPPETIGARKTAMPVEAQKVSENAQSGLRALAKLERTIRENPNLLVLEAVPGALGARELRTAKNEVADVITRLRTGAALNEDEQKFYRSQMPGLLDLGEEGAIDYKISLLRKLFTGLSQMKGTTGGGTNRIPVIQKSTGKRGYIPANEFDEKLYERR